MNTKDLLDYDFEEIWEIKLPCDVKVEGMTIHKGVHLKTLFIALSRREKGGATYEFKRKLKE